MVALVFLASFFVVVAAPPPEFYNMASPVERLVAAAPDLARGAVAGAIAGAGATRAALGSILGAAPAVELAAQAGPAVDLAAQAGPAFGGLVASALAAGPAALVAPLIGVATGVAQYRGTKRNHDEVLKTLNDLGSRMDDIGNRVVLELTTIVENRIREVAVQVATQQSNSFHQLSRALTPQATHVMTLVFHAHSEHERFLQTGVASSHIIFGGVATPFASSMCILVLYIAYRNTSHAWWKLATRVSNSKKNLGSAAKALFDRLHELIMLPKNREELRKQCMALDDYDYKPHTELGVLRARPAGRQSHVVRFTRAFCLERPAGPALAQ